MTPLATPDNPAFLAAPLAHDPHSYGQPRHVTSAASASCIWPLICPAYVAGTATWLLAEGSAGHTPGATDELILDTRDLQLEGISLGETDAGPTAEYHLDASDPVLGQALRIQVPVGTAAVRMPTARCLRRQHCNG